MLPFKILLKLFLILEKWYSGVGSKIPKGHQSYQLLPAGGSEHNPTWRTLRSQWSAGQGLATVQEETADRVWHWHFSVMMKCLSLAPNITTKLVPYLSMSLVFFLFSDHKCHTHLLDKFPPQHLNSNDKVIRCVMEAASGSFGAYNIKNQLMQNLHSIVLEEKPETYSKYLIVA